MNKTKIIAKTVGLRKANRYPVSAPVVFCWAPPDGPFQSGRGITRDINGHGIYVHTNELPSVGALIQMDVALPKLALSRPTMHLAGEGVVLRVEPTDLAAADSAKGGFAASALFCPGTTEIVLLHFADDSRVADEEQLQ
jgi:hypothetical protein